MANCLKTYPLLETSGSATKQSSEWFEARYSENVVLSLRIKEKIFSTISEFQKIEVMDSFDFGRVLALDNVINVTERDEFIYHEMLAHVPLFSHPNPQNVLVVGGGDGGIIREVAKHAHVKSAHLAEIDSAVIEVSKKYFPKISSSLSDPRVSILHNDATEYVKSLNNFFDVVIVDSTDPIGAAKQLFDLEFYHDCFNALTEHGILTAQSESPFFDPEIVQSLYAVAKKVFPLVKMYVAFVPSYVGGIWSFLYCSKQYDPIKNFQRQRLNQSGIELNYYNSEIHTASFALPAFIKRLLHV